MLQFRNILVSVSNLERSQKWYEENLGFHTAHTGYLPPLDADIAIISNGSLTLELACYRHGAADLPDQCRLPKTNIQTVGPKHFSFFVDDMEILLTNLRENGVEIVYTVEVGADRVAMIRDCDGMVIELVQKG